VRHFLPLGATIMVVIIYIREQIANMKIKRKTRKLVVQATEYMIAGGAWFWSAYIIILLATPVIGLWWANIIGNGIGVTINFALEKNWVFKSSKTPKTTNITWKYVVFTVTNFVFNYYILRSLQNIGIGLAIGQFISAGFFTFWNYFWYRFWVFKETPNASRIRHHV
jgi:putative flippase GtrA